jgi:methylmalonyl-CoA mutase, N-terminal domain
LRAKRNQAAWRSAIEMIGNAARSGENLLPRIVDAVEAHATVGEISDAMRTVFGEYQETVVI